MGLFGWLDRIAGRVDKKLEPAAAVGAAENAPASMTPVAAREVEKLEGEETTPEP